MALVPMKKVHLVSLLELKDDILKLLQRLQMVEIREMAPDEAQSQLGLIAMEMDSDQAKLETRQSELDSCVHFLAAYSNEKKGLLMPKPLFTHEELLAMESELDAAEATRKRAKELDTQLSEIRSRKIRLGNLKAQITPWLELSIPVEKVKNTHHVYMALGMMTQNEESGDPNVRLAEQGLLAEVFTVHKDRDQCAVFVLLHKKDREKGIDLLRQMGYIEIGFEGLTGLPKDIMAKYESEDAELTEQADAIANEAKELALNIRKVEHARDFYAARLERLRVSTQLSQTQSTFCLTGFVPEEEEALIRSELSKVTDCYHIEYETPSEEDVIPSAVKNKPLIQPFEAITNMYSPPSPTGIVDPTPLFAPWYWIFFGIMLGDALYGAILLVGCAAFYLSRRPPKDSMSGNIMKILSYCGITTIIWGLLTGGLAGITVAPIIWFNPLEEPTTMLGFCFAIGLVHIVCAMFVNVYMCIRRKEYASALFDQGAWLLILLGAAVLAVGMLVPSLAIMGTIGTYMAIAGAALVLLTHGRSKPGILKKITGGLGSLYGITSYLGDILSYARLFALGLSTSVIAMVINIICGMLGGDSTGSGIPTQALLNLAMVVGVMLVAYVIDQVMKKTVFKTKKGLRNIIAFLLFMAGTGAIVGFSNAFSYAAMLGILVGGHVFNLAINTLGSFVHTCRLQFIEFFGKFYESGGKPFKPLSYGTRYLRIGQKAKAKA